MAEGKSQNWPDWFLGAGKEVEETSEYFANARERLLKTGEEYVHIYPLQNQLLHYQDQLVQKGIINLEGQILKRHTELPSEFYVICTYAVAAPLRLFKLLVESKRFIIVHLLDSIYLNLANKNILGALSAFRSTIEHVSIFNDAITHVQKIAMPNSSNDALIVRTELEAKLAELTLGTRIDWNKFANQDLEAILSNRKNYTYKNAADRMDMTSDSVMNAIDRLNKKINTARGTYELLCEFAHPNIGATFAITESIETNVDNQGVVWVRKSIGIREPASFVSEFGNTICLVVKTVRQCIHHFEDLIDESSNLQNKVQTIVQIGCRELLTNTKDLFDTYSICPCASGEKIKFCCGKR
ncbi:MAG: hypothetical protein H6677_17020 [Candidatus Obscuribacterales bacterium]|nr:hypothetical protein [Candidatus Obscuribacterales bacterium]